MSTPQAARSTHSLNHYNGVAYHERREAEEREIEFESHLSRREVAEDLQAFTENLESGETIFFAAGAETVEFAPLEYLKFEIGYEEGDNREVNRAWPLYHRW